MNQIESGAEVIPAPGSDGDRCEPAGDGDKAVKPAIAIIINRNSGTTHAIDTDRMLDRLRAQGCEPSIAMARNGADIVEAAQRARADGVDVVVAGGGDGTINAVATVLIGSGIVLGVLPLGTLNHFAKDLGIPLELDQALQTIVDGRRIAVDVAQVNDRYFLNNSSIGIYPDIVKDRDAAQHRHGKSKWEAFFWACLKAARRYPFIDVELKADGQAYSRRTPFVFVGNNAYTISGFDLGGRKTLDAGCLSLYFAQRTGRLGLVGFAVRALFGRLRQAQDFDAMLTAEVLIRTRHKRIRVSTDGEVSMMDLPLRYRIHPGALHVIVPAIADVDPA